MAFVLLLQNEAEFKRWPLCDCFFKGVSKSERWPLYDFSKRKPSMKGGLRMIFVKIGNGL